MQFEGTVLYPQSANLDRESKYDAGHFAVKWDVNGDKVSTWHPRGEGPGQLRKGARAKLDFANGKWTVVPDSWNPADLVGGGQASHGVPASTGGQETYAPAPRQQPLDVVGAPGREEALNTELQMRLKMMNLAVRAAAKSLAQATGNWEPTDDHGDPVQGKPGRVIDPKLLDQHAIHSLATSVMIGLFQQNNYFGRSQDED